MLLCKKAWSREIFIVDKINDTVPYTKRRYYKCIISKIYMMKKL